MGTLHEVYQVKPRVINAGAILRVRKDKEQLFSEKYIDGQPDNTEGHGIFSNTFVTKSNDGEIWRYAMYATERIIDFGEPGIYVCIQDGSKHGFGSDFDEFLHNMSPLIEDALFYVIWDSIISRYEITNGKLYFKSSLDFSLWNYNFEEYLIANYTDDRQIIADSHADTVNEMILSHNEKIEHGENPNDVYDPEDYEELLSKINDSKRNIPALEFQKLEDWLREQIDSY